MQDGLSRGKALLIGAYIKPSQSTTFEENPKLIKNIFPFNRITTSQFFQIFLITPVIVGLVFMDITKQKE